MDEVILRFSPTLTIWSGSRVCFLLFLVFLLSWLSIAGTLCCAGIFFNLTTHKTELSRGIRYYRVVHRVYRVVHAVYRVFHAEHYPL